MKQKRDRYEMHKYWGKKPSSNLGALVRAYSSEGDTVLDPFSGYGVFCCEAFILKRNVISNDLNPIANFLNTQLFDRGVNLKKVEKHWITIKSEFSSFVNGWFEWDVEGRKILLISVLRNKDDLPIKAKYKIEGERKAREIEIEKADADEYLKYETSQIIHDWHPDNLLIENSRISAQRGMTVASLFTKRTLSCHARLLHLIENHSDGKERELLKLAFTANLANCSKLVPPINSRGDMAPGAWMTGFYTGETYIENNVLIYFENRLNKAIKGKNEYFQCFPGESDLFADEEGGCPPTYRITQDDVKSLSIKSESVDYVFADPPYGEAVPYFEQSVIWNSWLKLQPDYENEIVISDSKMRNKRNSNYEFDINLAFSEIRRVLKNNKYFSLTYHSLSGYEWRAITNACVKNGFELYKFEWLVQKSFTPRQINRMKSIKGDVLVTLRKLPLIAPYEEITGEVLSTILVSRIHDWLSYGSLDTNQIFLKVMEMIFKERIVSGQVDILELLVKKFKFNDEKNWMLNDELKFQTA
ncbi:DNA methyltransferase [Crenothrix sp.]|uniref:DNA methyltransferase n=1 Tax=Crenothrix sp. TaxID=3100433 RepID=UPI00374D9D77